MSDTPHVHLPKDSNSKRLLTAFLVTAVFMVAEVVGGLLSGSLALLADAGHMLTDAAALLVALMAVHFSQRKPNARHTFGYLRLTTTGGLPQRRSAAGDRGIHPVGGNTAFLRTAAGDGYPDVDHRRSGAAGEPVRLLAAPPRQRREKYQRARRRTACAGRPARFSGRHRRRHRHSCHRLDPD